MALPTPSLEQESKKGFVEKFKLPILTSEKFFKQFATYPNYVKIIGLLEATDDPIIPDDISSFQEDSRDLQNLFYDEKTKLYSAVDDWGGDVYFETYKELIQFLGERLQYIDEVVLSRYEE